MVGFFFFFPFIFIYLDPGELLQTTYILLDLTPLLQLSRIIFRLSELARRLLFPIGCLSILNSNQIFSSLISRRRWRSYTQAEKIWYMVYHWFNWKSIRVFCQDFNCKYVDQCSSHSVFGNMWRGARIWLSEDWRRKQFSFARLGILVYHKNIENNSAPITTIIKKILKTKGGLKLNNQKKLAFPC